MKKSLLWKLILVALLLGAGVAYWQMSSRPVVPPALQGMGGDFTLTSSKGPLSLHDFKGKVVLVYFGYTHCPDICPTALGVIAGAIEHLPARFADRAQGIFVSVDPRRDTPALLDKYTVFFDPHIHGVTGSPEQLAKIAAAWRVGYSVPDAPAGSNYAVQHSTFIYLVNPDGKVAALFDEKTSPDDIITAMRRWLN